MPMLKPLPSLLTFRIYCNPHPHVVSHYNHFHLLQNIYHDSNTTTTLIFFIYLHECWLSLGL